MQRVCTLMRGTETVPTHVLRLRQRELAGTRSQTRDHAFNVRARRAQRQETAQQQSTRENRACVEELNSA